MLRFHSFLSVCSVAIIATACGTVQTQAGAPQTLPEAAAARRPAAGSGSTGNIYWNKGALHLRYPAKYHAKATLSYWAPNGYFTLPISCRHSGKIDASRHRLSGNPSGYMNAVYWFSAKSAGPDDCSFTAVLNNTGSPPIATLTLYIDK